MPAGATWGNATGNQPPGVDIRGHGGYVVAPPSLHRWATAISLKPGTGRETLTGASPDRLSSILDNVAAGRSGCSCRVGEVSPTAPDLTRWPLAESIVASILAAPVKGTRSETDFAVIAALVRAGCTDTDIASVFAHYPVGTHGKAAEAGDRYLALTIGKVRAKVDPEPTISQTYDAVRFFLRWVDGPDCLPELRRRAEGLEI